MNETARGFFTDGAFAVPLPLEQERMVEAVLFASRGPLTERDLAERLPQGCDIPEALAVLRRRYEGRGVQLAHVGDGWAFRTAADLGFLLSREVVETRKLSRAAIETLAIVAYHQPVTRAQIEEIRGVSVSGGTLDQLIELGWVRLGRRRLAPGRPMTFVVTPAFLDQFGLESENDLPGIAELRSAGLLDNRPGVVPGPSTDVDDLEGYQEARGQTSF
jgi:segregation and condensation protein B